MVETTTKQLTRDVKKFVKHQAGDEVTVEEDRPSSEERKNAVMGMPKSAVNVWILPSMKRTFIAVKERCFQTYVTDVLGALNNCYIRKILDDGHIDLLPDPTERNEIYEKVE